MKIWIVGAGGLLGRALAQTLYRRGIAFEGSIRSEADAADLRSLEAFYKRKGPFSHIVNCAAYTKVDLAESNPAEAHRANAEGPEKIGQFAASIGMRVIHVSTDYVFDGVKGSPYLETDPIAPKTVYGKTKAEGEARLMSALPSACIVRTSWLFGEGGKSFVGAIVGLMRSKEEVRVVFDQIGKPTYAGDLADGILGLLDQSGIYHMADAGETSWHGFAEAIYREACALGDSLCCKKIVAVESAAFSSAAQRPAYSVLDTAKAERALKRPMPHWNEGLKNMLKEISCG